MSHIISVNLKKKFSMQKLDLITVRFFVESVSHEPSLKKLNNQKSYQFTSIKCDDVK